MNLLNSQRGLWWKTLASGFILVFLCGIFSDIYSAHIDKISGPAFTDPAQIVDMPDRWITQPVKHDPRINNADLVVSLDQQMFPAFSAIIKDYARNNGLRIVINNGTCGISSGMLSRKAIDIGGFCCPPDITDRLPGVKFHTVGIAAIAIIVHPDNPIDNISIDHARQIFMGEIYRWSELHSSDGRSGKNLTIQPVGRLHCKLRPGHWRLLLASEDLFSPGIIEVGAIPDMITRVSRDVRAVGYETIWMMRRFQYKGRVKPLKINGYEPDNPFHLISGRYPLYRVYNLTTWEGEGLTNPVAQKLVDFLIERVNHLDPKFGLIPVSRLRQAGWKFEGDELVGEPEQN